MTSHFFQNCIVLSESAFPQLSTFCFSCLAGNVFCKGLSISGKHTLTPPPFFFFCACNLTPTTNTMSQRHLRRLRRLKGQPDDELTGQRHNTKRCAKKRDGALQGCAVWPRRARHSGGVLALTNNGFAWFRLLFFSSLVCFMDHSTGSRLEGEGRGHWL